MAKCVQRYAEFYTDMCLQSHEFLQYDQLTLSCGIIMAARQIINVSDLWPYELQVMTGFRVDKQAIRTCMNRILGFYQEAPEFFVE